MRLSVLVFALVCGCALVIGSAAPPLQDQQDDVRGAFLTSRPKDKAAGEPASRPSRRRPRPSATPNNPGPGKSPEKKPNNPAGPSDTAKNSGSGRPVNVKRIGLGMTLLTRDANGLAVRADPEHVFRKGDRVRLVLETNTDGYLYIFNTTNDGPPILIYPDSDLDEAGNYMQAHVPFEIPSSTADQERFRWLVFDEVPGTERLFLVFTREPLNGVPIEDDLISYCKAPDAKCPWRPPTDVWAIVQKQMQEPLATDNKNAHFGRAQTAPEAQAATRGLSLAKDDPEPSVIMMASSTSPMLVATLDLIHK